MTASVNPGGGLFDTLIPGLNSSLFPSADATYDLGSSSKRYKDIYYSGKLIGPTIGPSSAQQHTIPAVSSDTLALLNATQTLASKTLSNAILSGTTVSDMAASQAANTTLYSTTINNTQTNSVIVSQLNLGTSGKSQGILIKGTGSFPASNTELDKFLTLWGNTNGNSNKVLSIGDGTTFNESWYGLARGDLIGSNQATISIGGNNTTAFNSSLTGVSARTSFKCSGENLNNNTISNDFSNTQITVTTAKTDYYGRWDLSRSVSTAVTVTDTYALTSFKRTNITNHASATLNAQGEVVRIENIRTQTLGTCTDTVVVLKAIQDANSTGDIYQAISGSTKHFYVKSNGLPGWIAADTQTTVGIAGGASAVPATPLGYAKIDVTGIGTVVVAYYNP